MASKSVEVNFADFELRKHFECPVCLEEPQNIVYQCRMGGHIICKDCYVDIINENAAAKCPVCRKPLPTKRFIRNNFFERFVASLKDISVLKLNVTKTDTKVKEVSHGKNTVQRRCDNKKLNLCKLLGFTDCNFGITSRNTKEAVQHFVSNHKCLLSKSEKFHLELANFQEKRPKYFLGSRDDNQLWTPVIVELKEGQGFLLIMAIGKKDSVGWFSLFLPNPRKTEDCSSVEVEFTTKTEGSSRYSFIQKPTCLQKLQEFSSLNCPIQYQISSLSPIVVMDGSLMITCHVREAEIPEEFNLTRLTSEKLQIDKNYVVLSKLKTKLASLIQCLSPSRRTLFGTSLALCALMVALQLTTNITWESAESYFPKTTGGNPEISSDSVVSDAELFKIVVEGSFKEFRRMMRRRPIMANSVHVQKDRENYNLLMLTFLDENKRRGFSKAQLALEMGANLHFVTSNNQNVLHIAAMYSHVAAVEYFLMKGFDVNSLTFDGLTPLHSVVAANAGHLGYISRDGWDVIKLLLKNGADCNIKDNKGQFALPIGDCLKLQKGQITESKLKYKFHVVHND